MAEAVPQGNFFLDETRRLRTFWRFLLFGIGFIVVEVATTVIALVLLILYMNAVGRRLDLLNIEAYMVEFAVMAAFPHAVLALILIFLFRRFLDRRSIASMGFVWPRGGMGVAWFGGIAIGAASIVASAAVVIFLGGYEPKAASANWLTLAIGLAFIPAAFYEEIVFRSYLLQNFLDIRKKVVGVLLTSFLFWVLHGLNPGAWVSPMIGVNLFGAGVVLSLAYMASGNIWFPTALHFAWNFTQGVALGIPVSGIRIPGLMEMEVNPQVPHWITGGEFGLEASILVTLSELVMIGIFLAWLALFGNQEEPVNIKDDPPPKEVAGHEATA